MSFGKPGDPDAEGIAELLPDGGDKLGTVFEIVCARSPVRLVRRRIPTQGEDITDVAGFDILQNAEDFLFGMADAG